MRWISGLLTASVALVVSSFVLAQTTTGTIVGTVADDAGSPLPGVTVTVEGNMIAGTRTTLTNSKGVYRLSDLPPGSYDLAFQSAGFATTRRMGIRVMLGATEEVTLPMTVSSAGEELTVTGQNVIDTQTNRISTHYDEDWVRHAPISRFSFFDFLRAAPGVTESMDSLPWYSVLGSAADENSFLMDGTDLTASYQGNAWPFPNTDITEEVEVLILGAPAEFGNVSGAVFNVATRQGTNAFHGDVNAFFQTDRLTGDNTTALHYPDASPVDACPDDPNEHCPFHRDRYTDATMQVSGPILKDRLWLFASYQYQSDRRSSSGTDPDYPNRIDTDQVYFKLPWQVAPRHRLALGLHQEWYTWGVPVLPDAAPSSIYAERGDNPTPNLMYSGILSHRTTVDARLSGFLANYAVAPLFADAPKIQPRFLDVGTGAVTGGIAYWSDSDIDQAGGSVKVSHLADDFLGRVHDFRFGVQVLRGEAVSSYGYNDYLYVYTADGGSRSARGYGSQPFSSGGVTDGIGVFADDSIRMGKRLTLNLGVRFDHNVARTPEIAVLDQEGRPTGEQLPGRTLYTWNVVSPRVGFNLELTADGRTVLRGHYGRYHRRVIMIEYSRTIGVSPHETRAGDYDLATGAFIDPVVVASSQDYDVAVDYVNADGRLAAERPHSFRAQVLAELPVGFLVAVNGTFESGRAWPHAVYVPDLGFPTDPLVQMESRGGRRLPARKRLDPRVQKTFGVGSRVRFVVLADVFNLLNEDAPQWVLSRVGTAETFGWASDSLPPDVSCWERRLLSEMTRRGP